MAQVDLLKECKRRAEQALVDTINVLNNHKEVKETFLGGKAANDVMDYLGAIFGFQDDNVENQREHVVHLLTNTQLMLAGLDSKTDILAEAVRQVSDRTLQNYELWYEHTKDWVGSHRYFKRERLLTTCLYLLIWGEAANLRFMPECLCYIFHHMLVDLFVRPLADYGTDKSFFLNNVIKPIHFLLESERSRSENAPHTRWSNYDDFNELFWSSECKEIFGWGTKRFEISADIGMNKKKETKKPVSMITNMFKRTMTKRREATMADMEGVSKRWDAFVLGHGRKVNFLEHRTFLHIYHSFHRLWIFLLMMLQGMIVGALTSFSITNLKYFLSLAPTHALMMLIQAVLDLVFCYDPRRLRRFFTKSYHNSAHVHSGAHKYRVFAELLFYASATGLFTFLYIKMLSCNPQRFDCDADEYYRTYKIIVAVYFGAHLAHAVGYTALSCVQIKSNRTASQLKWLFKEQYFIGHNMRVKALDILKYGTFWTVVFAAKFYVSYKLQIKPLIGPTRIVLKNQNVNYVWHDLVSKRHYNALAVASMWAPLALIYFLDVQIWYTVFSAIYGCIRGGISHLGEIRTMGMFVESFCKLPGRFASQLINQSQKQPEGPSKDVIHAGIFAPYWNELVTSLREEDYISNQEKDELLMVTEQNMDVVQWPRFIVFNKIQLGLSLTDNQLVRQLRSDRYMRDAAKDIYCNIEAIVHKLVVWKTPEPSPKYAEHRQQFMQTRFKMDLKKILKEEVTLKILIKSVVELVNVLHGTHDKASDKTPDAVMRGLLNLFQDFAEENVLRVKDLKEQEKEVKPMVDRLFKLLHKGPALSVPSNSEARRRLIFFGNSLGMTMPKAPLVKHMLSFSVLTPHYEEVVMYSLKYLAEENKDGISNLYYLQLVYSDEWEFFLERNDLKAEEVRILSQMGESDDRAQYPLRDIRRKELDQRKYFERKLQHDNRRDKDTIIENDLKSLRLWASYRGQTLARTVRGMMLYRNALICQDTKEKSNDVHSAEDLTDLKFTYVVTCQMYDKFRKSGNPMATDIDFLMKKYPALRVAYIAEDGGKYQSKLRKLGRDSKTEEMYSIDLPGNVIIGEGKPENQNHAIIFTRGDALQTIDMNQDNYFEEALKMRNLLEEFKFKKYFMKDLKQRSNKPDSDHERKLRAGRMRRTILGVREHVFTGSVSSLAWFMSNQETSFVTIGQRVMANPLKVRMHYGHPDVFDRVFHLTRGGISKASKTINLSEDIFAGFNSTLRGGRITHHEYIQVGKGRDLGLNQITAFEAKVSGGNGEQMLSRDVYRLGRYFDFGRMLSFYSTSVGYYVCTLMVIWALYAYMYGKVYLALSGVEREISETRKENQALKGALAIQFTFQTGIFNCVPMIAGYVLEQGFLKAVQTFVLMVLLGSPIFFSFSLATRSHYFGRTLLHGGAKYLKTGRGFVIEHVQYGENYRFYARSHFNKGLELAMLLVVYTAYGQKQTSGAVFFLVSNFLLAACWLYGPFIFNPLGFEWQKSVEDISDWNKWLTNKNPGAEVRDSWSAWWEKQTELHGLRARFYEVILNLRFFIIQYGIVYQLTENKGNNRFLVYVTSLLLFLCLAAMLAFTFVSTTSRNKFRFAHALALAFLVGLFLVGGFLLLRLTLFDVFAIILALIPTGWGLLSIAVACKPCLHKVWWMVSTWAWCYDATIGYFIFAPVIFLSWFPFISPLHTRILYNQAFSRGLEISVLLSGQDLKLNKQ